jgi:teichoic acid transport system permease protein
MQNILPFAIRTGLYLSPILYEAGALSERVALLKYINPLFPLLNSWSRVITHNQAPLLSDIFVAILWALGLLIIGSLSFISREDEFVVRI